MDTLKEIKFIVIHHSTRNEDSLEFIKQRHLKRGFEDIGYHYLIDSDGILHKGRAEKFWGGL